MQQPYRTRVLQGPMLELLNSETRQVTDFTSHFSFIIDTQGRARYAAGLAFFLAPIGSEIPPNSAVEHVGININSISLVTYAPWNFSLYSEVTADAWISYNASTRNLSVTWSYQNSTSQGNSSLSHQIDLSEILPETAIVGISASTSNFIERHQLVSWEFNSSLERKATKGKNRNRIRIIVGLAVPFGVLIIRGCIGFQILLYWRRKRSHQNIERTSGINDDLKRGAGPRRFCYSDLVSATNNFSEHRKLGEGGFGAVYRGYLNDLGTAVAVKRISSGSRQGKKEYVTEVKVISQLRHRNLVQLMVGATIEMSSCLSMNSCQMVALIRTSLCVVHRDIKSSNVMLDSSFNELGDFGLAKLMDHELGPKTTWLAGTLGYLAPEYISTVEKLHLSVLNTNVLPFGQATLDITIVAQMEAEFSMTVKDLVKCLQLALLKKLDKDFDEKQMECLMIVGLWCTHQDCNSRPSIRQAIHVLHSESPIPNLPAKMPVPMYHVSLPSVSPGSKEPSVTYSSLNVGR
ncbi:Concanavalin A-like lectin protein kinase family protein [Hibiscus syriacus]|uniref:Concanavalin A-like lectin protein kinase family protein n=1 Tax=Hibiscus syriacus TaxID=106335 RepID=A0A6A2XHQ1_HIBSY|nr:Concanavalin A-like lectin protein kinase family protein [Hibiscus syriacus]